NPWGRARSARTVKLCLTPCASVGSLRSCLTRYSVSSYVNLSLSARAPGTDGAWRRAKMTSTCEREKKCGVSARGGVTECRGDLGRAEGLLDSGHRSPLNKNGPVLRDSEEFSRL